MATPRTTERDAPAACDRRNGIARPEAPRVASRLRAHGGARRAVIERSRARSGARVARQKARLSFGARQR
eukprot:8647743-Pyramimonas_sp.AAC.1